MCGFVWIIEKSENGKDEGCRKTVQKGGRKYVVLCG